MGACSSCLGRDIDRDLSDEDEQSRLLFDDPHANGYGSFGNQNAGILEEDPVEVQRAAESLQKVVAQTSNHLVDIFATNHQPVLSSGDLFGAQDMETKATGYEAVLANILQPDLPHERHLSSPDGTLNASDGWDSENESVEENNDYKPVESHGVGPFLGGFPKSEPDDR